jgi:hypothetical protein
MAVDQILLGHEAVQDAAVEVLLPHRRVGHAALQQALSGLQHIEVILDCDHASGLELERRRGHCRTGS